MTRIGVFRGPSRSFNAGDDALGGRDDIRGTTGSGSAGSVGIGEEGSHAVIVVTVCLSSTESSLLLVSPDSGIGDDGQRDQDREACTKGDYPADADS